VQITAIGRWPCGGREGGTDGGPWTVRSARIPARPSACGAGSDCAARRQAGRLLAHAARWIKSSAASVGGFPDKLPQRPDILQRPPDRPCAQRNRGGERGRQREEAAARKGVAPSSSPWPAPPGKNAVSFSTLDTHGLERSHHLRRRGPRPKPPSADPGLIPAPCRATEYPPQAGWKSSARISMLCRGGASGGAPGSAKAVCGENRAVPSRALS
jgi:hypothetical protein